jgi:hypothetical protein
MVQIHSLWAKTEYNGKTGKIVEHHTSTSRYSEQLLPTNHGLVLQVRSENLTLTVGSVVKIHSLWAKPEHNGKTGKIVEYHTSTRRYSLQLLPESHRLVLQVRPENMKQVKHNVSFVRESMLRCLNHSPRRGSDQRFRDPVTGLSNDNVHEPMTKFDDSKTCFVFISHRWAKWHVTVIR